MNSADKLIKELIRRRDAGELTSGMDPLAKLPRPLPRSQVQVASEAIGHNLPELLSRIYTEVANGGFGDSYGLLGLIGGPRNEAGFDAPGLWKEFTNPDPDDEDWKWPARLLPVGQLGCAAIELRTIFLLDQVQAFLAVRSTCALELYPIAFRIFLIRLVGPLAYSFRFVFLFVWIMMGLVLNPHRDFTLRFGIIPRNLMHDLSVRSGQCDQPRRATGTPG